MKNKEQLKQQSDDTFPQQQQSNNIGSRIYDVTAGIQSKHTRATYQHNFDRFLNKINIHDLQVLLDFSPKVIKQMITGYIHYLSEERKMRRDSIKTQIAPIIHFFKINNDDFHLRMDNFKLHLPPDDEFVNEDRSYTTEEIAQVIGVCDLRVRAVILLMASTGMRIGALPLLRIGDLSKISFQGSEVYKVQVYARTRDKFICFTTPEAARRGIDEYLDYRARSGETLKDEAPLIREQFNIDDSIRIQYPRFVTLKAIEYLLLCNLKRSGARRPGKVHMSHGFRKFFMTQCEQSGMKSINVKMLLGHDIGVSGHYYRPAESDILEDYMTHAADALTISSEAKLRQQIKNKENEVNFIYEEISSLKRCVKHMTAEMKKKGYNTQKTHEVQNIYDDYTDKVTELADSDSTS
jgi:integrase